MKNEIDDELLHLGRPASHVFPIYPHFCTVCLTISSLNWPILIPDTLQLFTTPITSIQFYKKKSFLSQAYLKFSHCSACELFQWVSELINLNCDYLFIHLFVVNDWLDDSMGVD